jgi:transposase
MKNTTNRKESAMKVMAGIDLHSNNAMCGLMDMQGKRLGHRKVACKLEEVLKVFEPYRKQIDTVAVESTYNWYWLVDGLMDQGYKVALANPAQIDQYDGLKHTDDKSDVFFLTELLRLGILPTGYIYDRQRRPGLLRRRLSLVRQRTALILSFKNLHVRNTGVDLGLGRVKSLGVLEGKNLFEHPCDRLIAEEQLTVMRQLDRSIDRIEKVVLKVVKQLPCYRRLQTIPGIGMILGLTITLETGEVNRFATAGDYASYCRCVKSQRLSNQKSKGRNNRKCGNKYLAWAFVEAANCALRSDGQCRKFYERKKAQRNGIVGIKALACKLSKAAWHIMSREVDFEPERVFGARK